MRTLLLTICLAATNAVYAWNLCPDAIRAKSANQLPTWMEQRIASDLAFFADSGVTEEMISTTLDEVTNAQGGEDSLLVRIKISEGRQEWETPIELSEEALERLNNFLESLYLLDCALPLPELDFLVSFADHYDRPLLLRFTKAPIFTVSKSLGNRKSALFPKTLWEPDREALFDRVCQAAAQTTWEHKRDQAFWRGSLSEGLYPYFEWDFKPRPRLVFFSKNNPDLLNAGFVNNRYLQQFHHMWKKWMEDNGFIKEELSQEEQLSYRYLIAIDGSTPPDSLSWQMFSGSAVLKVHSTQLEWFYDGLEPGVHYFPVRNDSADLGEVLEWLARHPELGKEVADSAREFAEAYIRDEAAFLYTYHLLQAYSSLFK